MMSEQLYQKNLKVLRERFPSLARILQSEKTGEFCCVSIPSRTGEPTLQVERDGKRLLLHSRNDPKAEARRFAESSTDGTEQFFVLIGFGAGYVVEALQERNKGAFILVIEPAPHILMAGMKTRDLSSILGSDRVLMMTATRGAHDLRIPFDDIFGIHSPKFLVTRPYFELFPEKVTEIRNEVSAFLSRTEINIATLKRFDRLWTKNSFKNASCFFGFPGIQKLRDLLKGIPAAVICAGPSLDRDLAVLKHITDNLLLIAVDTALKPLLKRGITPDFVVTVDPQFINCFFTAHLGQLIHDPPTLIADPAVHPATLRGYQGPIFLTSSVFSPGRFIERFSGSKGTIAAGGSVSVSAFDVARIMGADPIILLGLDLSYGGGKTHVSGSFIEEYILSQLSRFQHPANFYVQYVRKGDPTLTRDRNGTLVFTDRRLLLYKKWFDNQPDHVKQRAINAASGGLEINGFRSIPLRELQKDLKKTRPDRKGMRKRLMDTWSSERIEHGRLNRFIGELNSLKPSLLKLRALCRDASTCSTRLLGHPDAEEGKRLTESLTLIDQKLLSCGKETELLSMVMQASISEVLKKHTVADEKEAFENSLKLYKSMDDGFDYLLNLIELALKKFKNLRSADDTDTKADNLL
jgi:hypothetical protein